MNDPIVIVSAARTPMGSFQGVFGAVSAPQLGAVAIKAAVGRAGVDEIERNPRSAAVRLRAVQRRTGRGRQ